MKILATTRGKIAFVDDEDYESLSVHKWRAQRRTDSLFHVVRNRKISDNEYDGVTCVYMHREIMKVTDRNKHVDHINGNGLDNRKSNLRICSVSQNTRNRRNNNKNNSSGYTGVCKHPCGKWEAYIHHHRKKIYLGIYDTPKDAAIARDNAAVKYHKEFARLNFS